MTELGSITCSTFISTASARSSPARWTALSLVVIGTTLAAGCPASSEPATDGSVPSIDAPGADAPLEHDAGPPGCRSDADCEDTIDCTTDTCVVASGSCRHTVTPALCRGGESCNPATGCEPGAPCATDEDCGDDDACTTLERCDPAARVCTFQPLDGDGDGDPPRVCGGGDCDDSDGDVFAGADERCNGEDDDCDGVLDNGADGDCDGEHAACRAGTCDCAEGYDDCAGRCVDLQTTPTACGTCDVSCRTGTCSDGVCSCVAGETFCLHPAGGVSPGCIDLSREHDNCGACGRACAATEECRDGACEICATEGGPCCVYGSLGCGDGTGLICDDPSLYTGTCVGCGGDNEPCCETDGSTFPCTVGSGACESDRRCHDCSGGVYCGTRCAQLDIDPENCGACGLACPSGTTCSRGTCA